MEIKNLDLQNQIDELRDMIYPVGSIYFSTNSANPSTIWGGTWTQIKGRFLIGVDPSDETGKYETSGQTGGDFEHTHQYGIAVRSFYGVATGADGQIVNIYDYPTGRYVSANIIETSDNAVNGALTYNVNSYAQGRYASEANVSTEAVVPPYYSVYIWERTA